MNPDKVKFEICRSFREKKQYFILKAPEIEDLIIPEVRICELPEELKRKFYMQQGISFRILMPALNQWIRENNEKAKNT